LFKYLKQQIRSTLKIIYMKIHIILIQIAHNQKIRKTKKIEKINVLFFAVRRSVWKFDQLFNLFFLNPRYNTHVVVCPYTGYGEERMWEELSVTYQYFKDLEYPVINTFDDVSKQWLNVKRALRPNIIFFTIPYVSSTKRQYSILNFKSSLTCYVPYGFNSSFYLSDYDGLMPNFVWKYFLENRLNKQYSIDFGFTKGENTFISGYPGFDSLIIGDVKSNPWKKQDKQKKRIIWSPHHTIEGFGADLDFSTFMRYHEFMFKIASRFKSEIQIAFKPHPSLRPRLSGDNVWGKEKTNIYYQRWEDLENGQVCDEEYIDLFLTSNAMIHDCCSFLVEYLVTKKPVMFLHRSTSTVNRLNEFGKIAMEKTYKGFTEQDIEDFVQHVIIDGEDPLRNVREQFYIDYLKPGNSKLASENIYEHIDSFF